MMVLAAIAVWVAAVLVAREAYLANKFLNDYYKRNPQMKRRR